MFSPLGSKKLLVGENQVAVTEVDDLVQVNGGESGEDEGLQEGDDQFQRRPAR